MADVIEAMAYHRPYWLAIGIKERLKEITNNRGILYDPDIVDICIKVFRDKGYKLSVQSGFER